MYSDTEATSITGITPQFLGSVDPKKWEGCLQGWLKMARSLACPPAPSQAPKAWGWESRPRPEREAGGCSPRTPYLRNFAGAPPRPRLRGSGCPSGAQGPWRGEDRTPQASRAGVAAGPGSQGCAGQRPGRKRGWAGPTAQGFNARPAPSL